MEGETRNSATLFEARQLLAKLLNLRLRGSKMELLTKKCIGEESEKKRRLGRREK